MITMARLSWDDYYIKMLDAVSERATCDRGRSACIITASDHQILATGYVGSPPGFGHCDDVGHELDSGGCIRTVHAEQNALASAARAGVPLLGSTWYTTMTPCRVCAMLIMTSGADRVVASYPYRDDAGLLLLIASAQRISVTVLHDESIPYAV